RQLDVRVALWLWSFRFHSHGRVLQQAQPRQFHRSVRVRAAPRLYFDLSRMEYRVGRILCDQRTYLELQREIFETVGQAFVEIRWRLHQCLLQPHESAESRISLQHFGAASCQYSHHGHSELRQWPLLGTPLAFWL